MAGPNLRKSVPRVRVRRGNVEDRAAMQSALIDAALALFVGGGLEAVTMRAVAQRVGVSPMAGYRYFNDKADLLSGLWHGILQELYAEMAAAVKPLKSARARQFAMVEAFLSYWERNPDHFRMVYMTDATTRAPGQAALIAQPAAYGELLEMVQRATNDFALELGCDLRHAKLASDLRFSMTMGYLFSMLINQRYPWEDRAALRKVFIDQVVASTERCLKGESTPRKATAQRRVAARRA